jgi:ribosome-interacting GTPase 1
MKAVIVQQEEAATVRQHHDKYVSTAMNQHATVEELLEAVFSVQSLLRLYNENHLEKLVSQRLELVVSSLESHC